MIHVSDFWFWNYIVFNPVLNQGPGVWFGLLVLNSVGSWTVQLVRHGEGSWTVQLVRHGAGSWMV